MKNYDAGIKIDESLYYETYYILIVHVIYYDLINYIL